MLTSTWWRIFWCEVKLCRYFVLNSHLSQWNCGATPHSCGYIKKFLFLPAFHPQQQQQPILLPSSRAFANYILSCRIFHISYIYRSTLCCSYQCHLSVDEDKDSLLAIVLLQTLAAESTEASLDAWIALKREKKTF